MKEISRINKLDVKFNVDKIKKEIDALEEDYEYRIGDGRDDVGFIWFEGNDKMDDTWELKKFQKHFNLDMAGIAKMKPKTCYAFHYDYSTRLHMAIHTSKDNFFLFDDGEQYHIPPDGHVYAIDTTESHTFINADNSLTRYHVGGHPHFLWSWDCVFSNTVLESYR